MKVENGKIIVGARTLTVGTVQVQAIYVYNLDGTGEVKITSDGAQSDFIGRQVRKMVK